MTLSSIADALGDGPAHPQTPSKAPRVFDKEVSDIKSPDKFRMEFFRKLSHQKVWVPQEQRSPRHQSLIIFDWDDTLMYTSYVVAGKWSNRTPNAVEKMRRIEKAVCNLLETALSLGHTFIITNAEEGWVEACVDYYMPSLKQIMKRVRIISARSSHQAECFHESEWKKRAFSQLGRQLDKQTITNLISIGDSRFEMEAVHLLGEQFSQCLVKTVQFLSSPTLQELREELDLVVPELQRIVEKGTSMKINATVERERRNSQKKKKVRRGLTHAS